jgi:GR25 family glycosyltransferase involved in LPS biosynthesis
MYLVLESDSQIISLEMIQQYWTNISNQYDLFFWGAWEGNMKIFRSTQKSIGQGYKIGVPYIKTVYCTYGYSLNAKAAKVLLARTRKFSYQVDQFKNYKLESSIRIGGVVPEIITNKKDNISYIQQGRNKSKEKFISLFLNAKNFLICYFK